MSRRLPQGGRSSSRGRLVRRRLHPDHGANSLGIGNLVLLAFVVAQLVNYSARIVHHGYFGGRTNHERWRRRVEAAGLHVVEMGTQPGTLWLLAEKPRVAAPAV